MLSNPTAADVLESVRVSLRNDIMPELQTDRARVLLQMMDTILASVQRRGPLEQQYMADECNRMVALLSEAALALRGAEGAAAAGLRRCAAAVEGRAAYPTLPAFAALNGAYREVSEAFTEAVGHLNLLEGEGVEAATALLARARSYINLRITRDMQAHFAMDAGLVGRG